MYSPRRLVGTFYTEFTDWNAVFRATLLRLQDGLFIDCMFSLLKCVFQQIKKKENEGRCEEIIRSYLHTAIQFMHELDRQHVKVYVGIIFSICVLDDKLKFTNGVRIPIHQVQINAAIR